MASKNNTSSAEPRNRAVRRHPEVLDDWRTQTTVRVDDLPHIMGISRNSAYGAVARGEIPSIRVGARILIPVAALRRLLGEVA